MKLNLFLPFLLAAGSLHSQTPDQHVVKSLDALQFLEGTWEAQTIGAGNAGADAKGTYIFRKELDGHVLARHSRDESCRGPAEFNCDHHDLLYIYQDFKQQPLHAIYFDNEGHVIHYEIFMPKPTQVVLVSQPDNRGPQFRLIYELKDGIMAGKFQMLAPGMTDWKSYLEWSGAKH